MTYYESIMEHILPSYLQMGVSYDMFWDSCPTDLKPFVTAYNKAQIQKDAEMWRMGLYIESAVYASVAKNLHGRKASSIKYIDKPFLQKEMETSVKKEMTEEEKQKKREQFLMQLQVMEINFNNANH